MATLRDLKTRISSVHNTQKITKAMKMVSASKLRRSQSALMSLRPYAYKIIGIMNALKERVDILEHPLLVKREIKKVRVLIVSSDRGLCGSFNSNIIKKSLTYISEAGLTQENSIIDFAGTKAYDFYKKRYKNIGELYRFSNAATYQEAAKMADSLIDNYIKGDFDSYVVIYNEFKSAMTQQITIERLFPLVAPEYQEFASIDQFLYEPKIEEILKELLPKFVKIELLRILLESSTSEYAARMTAMDNATRNSADMIKKLSLMYNRRRQAAITTELMEIVGGKEAMENG